MLFYYIGEFRSSAEGADDPVIVEHEPGVLDVDEGGLGLPGDEDREVRADGVVNNIEQLLHQPPVRRGPVWIHPS